MQISRRNAIQTLVATALAPIAIGCGAGVGEGVVITVVLLKLAAVGAVAIATIGIAYFAVQNAYLDTAKKQLELEGMKDGKKTKAVIDLTDDQVKTIKEKGRVEIVFEDGKKETIAVKQRY